MTPYQRGRERRRMFAVKIGAYIAILAGVVSQSVIQRVDWQALEIDVTFGTWGIVRAGMAFGAATYVYVRYRRQGGLDRKVKYMSDVLGVAFAKGFTLMGLANIGS